MENKQWYPELGAIYPDFGECAFVTKDFVSFTTKNPPAALMAQQLFDKGWVVYYATTPYLEGTRHITTYKRRKA